MGAKVAVRVAGLLALGLVACDDGGSGGPPPDAAGPDVAVDARAADQGQAPDVALPDLAPPSDAARPDAELDAGLDAGLDEGAADAAVDAELPDAGLDLDAPDAAVDAGRPDLAIDAAPPDAASPDAAVDAEPPDQGPPPGPPPIISEVLARNRDGLRDEDGEASDWIELYNPDPAAAVDLSGWCLSDDAAQPCRWRFPDGARLPAAGFVVVFASGKDRRPAAGEWHTDFRLSGDGEQVVLADWGGREVDRLRFGGQVQDVSFGRPMGVERAVLAGQGTNARWRPSGPDDGWTLPDYRDDRWAVRPLGLGWDNAPAPSPAVPLADAAADFSGVQGAGGWTYGAWWASDDPDGSYAPDDFEPFPAAGPPFGEAHWFDGELWRVPDGDPPFVRLSATGGRPSGAPDRPAIHAVRRWTVPEDGPLRLLGRLGNPAASGDGVVGQIRLDGEVVYERTVDGRTVDYAVQVQAQAGQVVDWVLAPRGDDVGDGAVFTARIERPAVGLDADGDPVTDSAEAFPLDGQQGAQGWTYGFVDRGGAPDPGQPFDPEAFVPFGPDFWTGESFDWPRGNPPWTNVAREFMHPNGVNNGPEHWAVRRWTLPGPGPWVVRWTVRKARSGGRGLTARVFHAGAALDVAAVAGDDVVGVARTLVVAGAEGDPLDFAVDPTGPDGDPTDGTDHALVRVQISAAADYQGLIEGELVPIDHRPLDVRVPVRVPEEGAGRLALEVRYDDGFAAWLDGDPVAADNAPQGLLGQAPEDRTVAQARAPARWPLPPLAPGRHVLALRHFDAAADDLRGLLLPEVVAEAVTVQAGQRYLPQPTPGAPNLAGDSGPLVLDVTTFPGAEPAPGRAITVFAEVVEGGAPLAEVRLVYRVMFGDEVSVPMAWAAGRWRADIPGEAGAAGELIRWRVEAVDEAERVARLPRFEDPLDSEAWRGTIRGGHGVDSPLPVFHVFLQDIDRAGTAGGTRGALYFDGALYDNVLFDLHGQSTRSFPKKSYDVDFTRDHRFQWREGVPAWKDLNLLTNWADKSRVRNTMAYEVFAAAGNAHHLAEPVRVQLNGAFFAVYDLVEDGDDRWLQRLGYAEPLGALYKMYDRVERTSRGEKKTRKDEDKADLQALIDALGLAPEARRVWLMDHVDLARTANYLAASVVMSGKDCCHKNYYLYRDTAHTGQWWFLPWDVDLSLGRNWTGSYYDDTMYPDNGLFLGRDLGASNRLLQALYEIPAFTQMYLRRTRTLMDALVQPVDTPPEALWLEGRVAEWQARLAPDMALDDARWDTWGEPQPFPEGVTRLLAGFAAPRRPFLYGLVNRQAAATRLVSDQPGEAVARWRVPGPDTPADGWMDPDYPDGDWAEGPLALGYENAPADYAGLLRTEVRPADLVPGATTLQARVAFQVADPAALQGPVILRLRYEDGGVVWLNGVEVHRDLAGPLAWDAETPFRADDVARRWLDLPVDPALLVAGDNVLAAQVVNAGAGSSDLLLQVALLDGEPGGDGPLPLAQDPDLAPSIAAVEVADEPGRSYVRLHNPHADALDVSDWRLFGAGVEHTLVPGTVIPAGGDLFLVGSVPAFQGRDAGPAGGQGRFVQGNWRGTLDLGEEAPLELLRPDDTVAAGWVGE